ncbi:hypothetical protein ACFWJM_05650 [Streptomyces sp. NPDC127077]|uniref:hypothetical protein n=1 Tax=Streptomyces sp. NPDC127077 TaxID=3347131 RepID=UPI003653BCFD
MTMEVGELLQSGASTLLGLMVSDAWTQVRERFAVLMGGDRPEATEAVRLELDTARAQLLDARLAEDAEACADIQAEWRSRLRRLLSTQPELAPQLQQIIAEFTPPEATYGGDHTDFRGATFHGPVQGKGTMYNRLR